MDDRRYYGFDALRGVMMMLGIVLHASMFYLASPPPTVPLPTDHNTSYFFDIMVGFIHDFRMPAFFLLSGFFTSLLVEKRGVRGTYRNRGARVLAPLLVACVTVLPLTLVLMIDVLLSVRFGNHELIPNPVLVEVVQRELLAKGFPAREPTIVHLWFLLYLLYFYLLIPVCEWLVEFSRHYETRIRRFLSSPLALPVFGLCTAVTLWPFRGAELYEGFVFLKPHVPSLFYFGSFFVLGYVFHTYHEILGAFSRYVPGYALLALVLFPLSFYVTRLEYGVAAPAGLHFAAVILHGMCTWALVYLFMGCALRFFDYESPWILYTSQSSYWVFLVHMPAVAFAGWCLLPFDFPALLKFLIVLVFTTVVCLTSYRYWVQRTCVGEFLNGKRFYLDWPWLEPKPLEQAVPLQK